MLAGIVRACLMRGHCIAGSAVEGVVEEDRSDSQFSSIKIGEDELSIVGAVIVTNASVIATNDEVRAAVVFAHDGVEDGFTRASIAHGSGEHAKNDPIRRIVVL